MAVSSISKKIRSQALGLRDKAEKRLKQEQTKVVNKIREEVLSVTDDVQKKIDRVTGELNEAGRVLEEKGQLLRDIVGNILDRVEQVKEAEWLKGGGKFSKKKKATRKTARGKTATKKATGKKAGKKKTSKKATRKKK